MLCLVDSLVSADGKFLNSNEGIKLVSTDENFIGPILGNVDEITIGIDVGTELGYLDGSFGGSNYGKIEGLFLGFSLGYSDGKVPGSDEGIKLGLFYG